MACASDVGTTQTVFNPKNTSIPKWLLYSKTRIMYLKSIVCGGLNKPFVVLNVHFKKKKETCPTPVQSID